MLNNLSSAVCASDYYGQLAYRSDVIPPQKNQVEGLNRTGLDRSASLRLPWGNIREVVPPTFMSDDPPKNCEGWRKRKVRLPSSGYTSRTATNASGTHR